MDKILIFGHKNPDTDSVCGSIAFSYLKNKLNVDAIPCILGNLNEETKYALKKFKIDVPVYLNDVKPKIKDVNYHKNYVINENRPIIEAFNYMSTNGITGLPLIDDKKKFSGYISFKETITELLTKDVINIDTSKENLIITLNSKDCIFVSDNIQGIIDTGNYDQITEDSILVIKNDEKILKKLINSKISLIIITDTTKIDKKIKKLAKEKKVNLIATPYSLFKVAKIISYANPVKSIKRNASIIVYKDTDYLSDFLEETSRLKHTNYPIVDNKNVCLGMLRTIDAHEVKKKKVILIDHNTFSQSVDGIEEALILEIIDHHNIGNINTNIPVNFRNMSVGSVNTVIYQLFLQEKVKIPKNIAGIMLSGIISDTLLLKSPTTTELDRRVANALAKIALVSVNDYGLELLKSGVAIDNIDNTDIIYRDFKKYKINDDEFAIAQVFTTNFKEYKGRIEGLVQELDKISESQGYKCCCLFVTNFLTNNSYLLFSSNSKKVLEMAYGLDDISQGQLLRNVVSRKKQMVPIIMSSLTH